MRRAFPVFVLIVILTTACLSPATASIPITSQPTTEVVTLPTNTHSPSPTTGQPTPTPSNTPTLTPTPTIPYPLGVFAPLPSVPVLSPENVGKVEMLLQVPSQSQPFNVEFSDDGKWLMLATLSGAQIYDTQTFVLKKEFSNNFADFVDLYAAKPENIYRFIPEKGQIIANADMIWDLEKDKQIWSDPSAEKLEATKEYFGYPNVWEKQGEIGISAHSFVLGVTSNGKFAITGRDIWNLETLKIETISLDSDPRQITLSPDGSYYAATVYDDDLIHLFNLMDGKEILTIPNPAGREPWWQEPLFFTGDGKFLLAQANVSYQGGFSDSWTIYDVQNGTWSGELRPPLSANIQPGANYNFLKGDNPNPFWWESACDLHIYTLWPQQKINVLKIPAEPAICHTYGDGQSAYPPHQFFGNLLVTVTHNEKEYRLNAWNVETGDMFLNRAASEPAFVLGAHKDGLFFAFYKPDDGAIEIYGKDGSLVKRIEGHYQFSARKIIHSVDGKLRALLADDSVTLIDTSTQKMLRVFRPVIDSELTDTVFSTDSSTLLVVGDESQWLYSTADGSLLKSANLSFNSLNAIPGANLAVVSNGRQNASLYDITSLEQAKSFSAPGNSIGATAISPDGSLLAISGQRTTSVFIYTAADARVAQQLPVLKFAPNWMQFSPDGKNLYVADIETDDYPDHRNMLQTWDLTTGEMTLELEVIPNWLANYISTDEFKGTDFLLKSISLSRDGSFMVMRIRALDTNKTGIWKDRHILAFWRVGEKMPFAIWKSIDFNSDQSEWLDQNGTTRFEYALPHGKPAFSPDGKYLVFDDIEWWGVYP